MSDLIMAIDLGRFKCVVCLYRRSSREAVFRTIDTDGGAFEELFAEHPAALLVIEACADADGRAGGDRPGRHRARGRPPPLKNPVKTRRNAVELLF